jgi:hemoglobin
MDLLDSKVYSIIGDEGFARLCAAFFRRVPADPILGPMYEHDLVGAEWRLREFLVGRFGGPARYIEKRGHPRLRMRHAPFKINTPARNRWVETMGEALAEAKLPAEADAALRRFFGDAATFMINHPD